MPPPPKAPSGPPAPCPDESGAEPKHSELPAPSAEDKAQARAMYVRFYRSLRSSKAPPIVHQKFAEASNDRSGKALKVLFGQYIEAKEDWLSSSLVLTQTTMNDSRSGSRWTWMTKTDTCRKSPMKIAA